MNEQSITGSKVTLKPMDLSFVTQKYLGWLKDPEASYAIIYPSSELKELETYVKKRMADLNCRFWAILDRETEEHIGNVKLEPVLWQHKRAAFGILIGEKNYWGRGFGTEATSLVTEHAFKELGLNKVELGVKTDNKGAIRAYEKSGFVAEGVLKQHEFLHGKYHDIVMMAKFREH